MYMSMSPMRSPRHIYAAVPCKLKIKAEKGIQRRNDGERSLLKIELGKTGVFGLGEFRSERWSKPGGERLKIPYFESVMCEQLDFKLTGVPENETCVRNLGEKSNFHFLLRTIFELLCLTLRNRKKWIQWESRLKLSVGLEMKNNGLRA